MNLTQYFDRDFNLRIVDNDRKELIEELRFKENCTEGQLILPAVNTGKLKTTNKVSNTRKGYPHRLVWWGSKLKSRVKGLV